MSTDLAEISAHKRVRHQSRPWRSIVFAPIGDGQTRRRGSDAVKIGVASLVVLVCWLAVSAGPHSEEALVQVVTPPPDGVRWLVNLAWIMGSFGVVVGLVGLSLLARRWLLARDLAVAAGVALVLSLVLQVLTGASGGRPPDPALAGIYLGFPVARTAVAAAVAVAALPYLSRAFVRLVTILIVVAALAVVVHGSGMPMNVLASLALGWGVGAAMHLALGSPLGLPSAEEVATLLSDLGVEADRIAASARQEWGVARFSGRSGPRRIEISVYGRDAHDAQLLAKVFRFVFYRDSGPTLALTRVQQVEHEAYLTLLAARSGARVPDVVAAGTAGPSNDAVLVTQPPPGDRLVDVHAGGGEPSADAVSDVVRQVQQLQGARIAHGAISGETVVVAGDGRSGLVDFRCAVAGATPERLDRDLAGTLATLCLAVGPERTVAVARSVLSPQDLARALPYVQRAALDPVAAKALRGQKAMLVTLREQAAAAAGVEVPKLVEPRRLSWINFVMVVGTLIGGWALIGVLLDVSKSFSTIRGADWGWVVATFVFSQLAYPAEALTVVNSIVDPIPFGRTVALEVSNSFVALAGGSMAVLAARVRFFQQEGYDATLAVSSGVLISTVSWIVKGALFLIALPLAIGSMHFNDNPTGGSHAHLVELIVLAVVATGVVVGLVLAVPRFRRLASAKLRPKVSEIWAHLRILAAHPRNLIEILLGSIAAQLTIAFALGTALHAFGDHLGLATLLVVLTLASMLGGISPVPGGMGVVEAGMIIGLTAAGIPQTDAVAATFVQRLFTSYLPPIWGWFVLVGMRRREYL